MRKSFKKILALITIGAMTVSLMTGCGSKKQEATIDEAQIEEVTSSISTLMADESFQAKTESEKLEALTDELGKMVEDKKVKEESLVVSEDLGVISYEFADGGVGVITTREFQTSSPEEYVTEMTSIGEYEATGDASEQVTVIMEDKAEKTETAVATVIVEAVEEGAEVKTPEVTEEAAKEATEEVAEEVTEEAAEEATEEEAEEVAIETATEEEVEVAEPTPEVIVTSEPVSPKILVLDGFGSSRDYTYNYLEEVWNNNGISTATVDYDVKVEDLLTISDYNIATFSMHGSYVPLSGNGLTPVLCLSADTISSERSKELANYIANKELYLFNSTSGERFYAVTPLFFANEFESGSLENTYIFSEACEFCGWCPTYGSSSCDRESDTYCSNLRYDFVAALYNAGTPAVVGFHNSVMASYCINFMYGYVNILLNGYTPQIAYAAGLESLGLTDSAVRQSSYYYNEPAAYALLAGKDTAKTLGEEEAVDVNKVKKLAEDPENANIMNADVVKTAASGSLDTETLKEVVSYINAVGYMWWSQVYTSEGTEQPYESLGYSNSGEERRAYAEKWIPIIEYYFANSDDNINKYSYLSVIYYMAGDQGTAYTLHQAANEWLGEFKNPWYYTGSNTYDDYGLVTFDGWLYKEYDEYMNPTYETDKSFISHVFEYTNGELTGYTEYEDLGEGLELVAAYTFDYDEGMIRHVYITDEYGSGDEVATSYRPFNYYGTNIQSPSIWILEEDGSATNVTYDFDSYDLDAKADEVLAGIN